MALRRRFTRIFKRQVVEELLSGVSTMAQVVRRYDLSYNLVAGWRKAYESGGLEDKGPETEKDARIRDLERKVGELTMEIDLLKRAAKFAALQHKGNGSLYSGPVSGPSRGGAR
jgi:transposase-like protein